MCIPTFEKKADKYFSLNRNFGKYNDIIILTSTKWHQ